MQKTVSIIGGGAAALLLGCELDPKKFQVTIYEKNAAPARKFLVAGDGGLNLTHNEASDLFITRYAPAEFLKPAFQYFSNKDLIAWLNNNGIETRVGSSNRVFPNAGMKPIEVLNALVTKLKNNTVQLILKQEWVGFSEDNSLLIKHNDAIQPVKSDYVIFCLGGASWPVTGSTGNWTTYFSEKNIQVNAFEASNCAFKVNWNETLLSKTEGKVLKNVTISCGKKTHVGEVVITRFGLEGSGIYPLSPQIRQQLHQHHAAEIFIDLKPTVDSKRLQEKLNAKPAKTNLTNWLKTALNLGDVQIQLLKALLSKDDFLNAERLCAHIKQLKITVTGTGPIEDAISTVGGIDLSAVDENFELKQLPHHFAIGEMLDYDAPTGGYLLQSCFSMAKFLAAHLNAL